MNMLNKYLMIKNGTIAILTMFGVGILFGEENVMLSFPIALTSIVLGRRNFFLKPLNKAFRILCIHIIIVLLAFLSSINIYFGIVTNMFVIFFIIYVVYTPNDLSFYKPFVMLYVFCQYSKISVDQLPNRLLSIIFGVFVVFFCNFIIKKSNENKKLGNNIIESLKLISVQLNNILNDKFDSNIKNKVTQKNRELSYSIYVSRYKKYLTTNLGRIQFNILTSIEYLNFCLEKLNNSYKKGEINKKEILNLDIVIKNILLYCENKSNDNNIKNCIDDFIKNNKNINFVEFNKIFIVLLKAINELEVIDPKDINKIYKNWEKSDLDKIKLLFNKNNIKFRFAMRMAITLSIVIFIANILGFYKIIWAIITVMSIMQPYYEETIMKSKERIFGNVVAILFTGVLINIINNKFITISILILAMYLLYGYKEYYKISLFAGVASICIASLSSPINTIVFYRVSYVIIGVIFVIFSNKYIFPYKTKDGMLELVNKITFYNDELIKSLKSDSNIEINFNKIREIVIMINLMSQKLYIRNTDYKDDIINKFLDSNNNFLNENVYKLFI